MIKRLGDFDSEKRLYLEPTGIGPLISIVNCREVEKYVKETSKALMNVILARGHSKELQSRSCFSVSSNSSNVVENHS